MEVSLRLFAGLHDLVGRRDLRLELAEGATVRELKERIGAAYPAVQPLLGSIVCAIDDEYVAADQPLHDGAEVALIPPVSGGGPEASVGTEAFRITAEPLEAQALVDLVRRDESGAVALFYGVVRNHSEGRDVERLEYEAHASMALKKLREVAAETQERFAAIDAVGIWHRVGVLEIGETSLLVAVASPHRAEAFAACYWAVDRVKEVVPVWKKEHWRGGGGGAWVDGHAVDPPPSTTPE